MLLRSLNLVALVLAIAGAITSGHSCFGVFKRKAISDYLVEGEIERITNKRALRNETCTFFAQVGLLLFAWNRNSIDGLYPDPSTHNFKIILIGIMIRLFVSSILFYSTIGDAKDRNRIWVLLNETQTNGNRASGDHK